MSTDIQKTQPKSWLRKFRDLLVLVALQVLIFLLVLEVIGRIADPVGISYFSETARFFDEVIVEEPIGYRLKPGLQGEFHGVPVEINDYGMRDRPVPDVKEPGEFRILAMGDSVIFSVGVPLEDSIPLQLERKLNEAATGDRKYRVLNMGVPSYNTVQQLEQFKQVGQYLQPDAALLYIIPNDIQDKLWVMNRRSNVFVDLSQRSYALGLIFYAARWVAANAGVLSNPAKQVAGDTAQSSGPLPEAQIDFTKALPEELQAAKDAMVRRTLSNPAWLDIENSVLEMHQLLRAKDVPLLVFYKSYFRATYARRLAELGEKEGFAVRELSISRDPRWQDIDSTTLVNSPADNHCNRAGCELYALRMQELMEQTGLLK